MYTCKEELCLYRRRPNACVTEEGMREKGTEKEGEVFMGWGLGRVGGGEESTGKNSCCLSEGYKR